MANQLDRSISRFKRAEDYVKCGLAAIPDFTSEYIDLVKESKEANEDETRNDSDEFNLHEDYKNLLKQYILMEKEMKCYLEAVEKIKPMVGLREIR